ncbi:zinc finger protein 157-like isoform X1 [Rhinatrema bivittatum]|uniref:zinc finger protein 157-like isoform X1 n=1 Tax=Rhinatrema bivittatum TaxID=194408 RepID=UPI0011261BA7|nr:zinc finger protein 157-like isoform X1 [Rhinatrema bivittatum]
MDTFAHKSYGDIPAKTERSTGEKRKAPANKVTLQLEPNLLRLPEEVIKEISQSVAAVLEDKIFKLQSSVAEMKAGLIQHVIKITELENRLAGQEDLTEALQVRIKTLEAQNVRSWGRVEDRGNHGRRNNSRLTGLPATAKDQELFQIFEKWIPRKLGLRNENIPLKVEWAHRVGILREDKRPRPAVTGILNFADKSKVISACKQGRDYKGSNLLFPEFLPHVTESQNAMLPYRTELFKYGIQLSLQFPAKVPVTFEDIAVYFSQEEWEDLEEWQKKLYQDVMKENYETVISLGAGFPPVTPDIISHIERGEEPYIREEPGSEERETGRSSCSESNELGNKIKQIQHEELTENMETNKMLPEGGGEDTFSCSDWGRNCRNQYNSKKKQRNSTGDSAENSHVGEQSASNITHIGREERKQAAEQTYLCDVCGIYLWDAETLKSHQRFHTEERPFAYTDSGRAFSWKGELLEEQITFTGKKPFSCSKCQKSLISEHMLIKHQKIHSGERFFPCTVCGKRFTRKASLKSHQKIHTGERPFSCSKCDKSFAKKYDLILHHRIHTGERPFSCKECTKTFIQKAALEMHQRIHTGERPFLCIECGKSFIRKRYLKLHQESHIEERPFLCTECDKTFRHKKSLLMHQKMHTGERPFSCSEHGKSFISKASLHLHQKIHTGERPFSCNECGRSFTRKTSLKAHQLIHTGERPFSCTECGKQFRKKHNLIIHKQRHTGEKPFSCTECGKSFTRKASLKSHQRIHMRETGESRGITENISLLKFC